MSRKLPNSYWRLFGATVVSNLGDGVTNAAGPLLALSLTDDVRLIAAVSFAMMVPWLALALPAGVFIDRHDRRVIIVTANSIRAAVFLTIFVLVVTSLMSIWTLIGLSLVLGAAELFVDMSAQAILPQIVDGQVLEKANGRLYAAEIISNGFIGLPFGAWLFVFAAAYPFGLCGIATAVAALIIFSIKTTQTPRNPDKSGAFGQEILFGLKWLWSNKLLRTLAIMLGFANMCGMFGAAIFVKYARDELGLSAKSYGLLLAAISIGSIFGSLVGEKVAKKMGISMAMLAAYSMFTLSDGVRAIFPNVIAVAISGVVMAAAGTVWNVLTVSLRQRLIPTVLFGRVNSVYRFIGTGSISFGALIGGQISYAFGLRAGYMASFLTLSGILILGGPRLTRYSNDLNSPTV